MRKLLFIIIVLLIYIFGWFQSPPPPRLPCTSQPPIQFPAPHCGRRRRRHTKLAYRLLQAKADIRQHAGVDGASALTVAAGGDSVEVLELLLEAKASRAGPSQVV